MLREPLSRSRKNQKSWPCQSRGIPVRQLDEHGSNNYFSVLYMDSCGMDFLAYKLLALVPRNKLIDTYLDSRIRVSMEGYQRRRKA
jgi:hypothetical protein